MKSMKISTMTDGVIRIGLRGLTDNEGIALCDYPLVSRSTGRYKNIISGGGGQFQLNSLITVICIKLYSATGVFFFLRQQTIWGCTRHKAGYCVKKH